MALVARQLLTWDVSCGEVGPSPRPRPLGETVRCAVRRVGGTEPRARPGQIASVMEGPPEMESAAIFLPGELLRLSVCLFICLSVCLSVSVCVCLSIFLFHLHDSFFSEHLTNQIL